MSKDRYIILNNVTSRNRKRAAREELPSVEYDINDTSVGLEREHAALSWLRANDPVHWDVKNEAWLITRNAEVREVLHHSRTWSSAHGYFTPSHMSEAKSSILTLDDPNTEGIASSSRAPSHRGCSSTRRLAPEP